MHKRLQSEGLQILGFPCGQFMNQELSTEKEIKEFVADNFKVEFPMFSKIEVNGEKTHPVYSYLKSNCEEMKTKDGLKNIPWNFAKFMVDYDGKVLKFYGPKVTPKELEVDVISYLKNNKI
eukprot:CAMPEP_0170515294 /NCGR_PEP_ID=MMETSP0209-20121228/1738_1 /TAXON_ID=665100 ORGANISM="Litonotus pictus, Strain P1" /NCGR_SAMPLE_ID=MMETSP0209 /ASSEMBLY_ACC=CAM_ASM_000301 /LENGTH=120 /DNA_ID=CAMNT_0010799705 /DNA_START=204 /DNA_END=566 /DNA_ORIENTATION=+